MFTGIITELGTVVSLEKRGEDALIVIQAPASSALMKHGASLAVEGVCLSTIDINNSSLSMEVMGETLKRTTIGQLQPHSQVNLELPMKAGSFLDGHIVQGHVDGVGTISAREDHGPWETVRIALPNSLARYVAEKGSIAIDGISLTVTAVSAKNSEDSWFEVGLIPITRAKTTLGTKKINEKVNLEVDIVAKYLERLTEK